MSKYFFENRSQQRISHHNSDFPVIKYAFSNKITIFSQPHQKLSLENLAAKNFLADSFTIPPKSRIYQIAARGKLAIGDGVSWTCKRKANPEAQLGESLKRSLEKAVAKAMSLGGSVVASHHG